MVVNYARGLAGREHILYKYSKMVLAVGDKECEALEQRFQTFSPHFEKMQFWDADGISRIEPNVVWGRTERIVALGVEDDYTGVNFHALADSFVAQARQAAGKSVNVHLGTKVSAIRQHENGDGTPEYQVVEEPRYDGLEDEAGAEQHKVEAVARHPQEEQRVAGYSGQRAEQHAEEIQL